MANPSDDARGPYGLLLHTTYGIVAVLALVLLILAVVGFFIVKGLDLSNGTHRTGGITGILIAMLVLVLSVCIVLFVTRNMFRVALICLLITLALASVGTIVAAMTLLGTLRRHANRGAATPQDLWALERASLALVYVHVIIFVGMCISLLINLRRQTHKQHTEERHERRHKESHGTPSTGAATGTMQAHSSSASAASNPNAIGTKRHELELQDHEVQRKRQLLLQQEVEATALRDKQAAEARVVAEQAKLQQQELKLTESKHATLATAQPQEASARTEADSAQRAATAIRNLANPAIASRTD